MAVNRVFAGNEKNNIAREVPEGTRSGDFLVVNGRPAVAINDRAGSTKSETLGPYTIVGPSGGAGLKSGYASLATDGTYDLPVTGAGDSTGQDVAVYYIAADGSTPASLTITSPGGSPVIFGYTNYPVDNYNRKDGIAPVRMKG